MKLLNKQQLTTISLTSISLTVSFLLWTGTVLAAQVCRTDIPTVANDSNFIISTDNIWATHRYTGLTWRRCAVGQSIQVNSAGIADDTCTGTATNLDFEAWLTMDATETTWSLPNAKELMTLRRANCTSPALNTNVFPTTVSGAYFWVTSTPSQQTATFVTIAPEHYSLTATHKVKGTLSSTGYHGLVRKQR